jgi:hypothetical protein
MSQWIGVLRVEGVELVARMPYDPSLHYPSRTSIRGRSWALARDESSSLAAHPDAIDFDRSPPGRQRRRPLAPRRRITRPKFDVGGR